MDTRSDTREGLATSDALFKVPFTWIVAGAPLSGKTRFVQRLMEDSAAVTDLFCDKVQHAKVNVMLLIQNLFYHGKERTTLVR